MLAQLLSGAVLGIDAIGVNVEVDAVRGLPNMTVVGLADSSVREGRERVQSALSNSGFALRPRRITVSLAPADVRKDGSAFDLPMALGVLVACGVLPPEPVAGKLFVGELGLDGELRPVRGVLAVAELCGRAQIPVLVVPGANAAEAAAAGCVDVRAAASLRDVVAYLRGRTSLSPSPPDISAGDVLRGYTLDLADVKGQAHARRALEVAAAGQHNVLMLGPPGAGKSMLARRLPGILPPLTRAEALAVTKVHSVAGRLRPGVALVAARPFRAPHHTVSDAGLIGGGAMPRPGEISLAHHGVLFLDELPEFRRHVLEALRQPLEDGAVHIGRARVAITFPARCMLVAAMNPCPCGFHGTGDARCICNPAQIQRYLGRISGPLLDRIDIHLEVGALPDRVLVSTAAGEPSARVRERVLAAWHRQRARFGVAAEPSFGGDSAAAADRRIFANAHMPPRDVGRFCDADRAAQALLRAAVRRLGLSARAYHRVLRVARTIADLAAEERIGAAHVAEAIQYRTLDRTRLGYVMARTRR